jgi:hypothetical protein
MANGGYVGLEEYIVVVRDTESGEEEEFEIMAEDEDDAEEKGLSLSNASSPKIVSVDKYDEYYDDDEDIDLGGMYANGGTTESADDYYENLQVHVQGVGTIYHGQSMKAAIKKANMYLSKKPNAEVVIIDEKYGDEYDLYGNQVDDDSMYAKGGTTESSDRLYRALKSGKRKSYKYASVEMRGGGVYHRRNANQYGKVKGGNTYYEYSENRSDSQPRKYLAKGGNISSLSDFNINDLDNYEKFIYDDMSKKMSKEDALQIIINNVEGDYSQLSPKLRRIAKKQ